MGRKVLQDLANVLCQMVVGWRMGNDLSTLIEIGNTQIFIDALVLPLVLHLFRGYRLVKQPILKYLRGPEFF